MSVLDSTSADARACNCLSTSEYSARATTMYAAIDVTATASATAPAASNVTRIRSGTDRVSNVGGRI